MQDNVQGAGYLKRLQGDTKHNLKVIDKLFQKEKFNIDL